MWRRENDIRSELEKTKEELDRAAEHVLEVELRCDGYENRARTAEIRYRDAVRILREVKETQQLSTEQLDVLAKNPRFDNDLKVDTSRLLRSEVMRLADTPVSAVSNGSNGSSKSDPVFKKPDLYDSPSPPLTTTLTREALVSRILEGNYLKKRKEKERVIY